MSQLAERFQCRHIMPAGHRCGSPALKGEAFCYFHHTTRKPVSAPPELYPHINFPMLEDRAAIQCSIGEILNRISHHAIDTKRAGLLLYGLQIAATLLPAQNQSAPASETIADICQDEQLGTTAPPLNLKDAPHEKSLAEILNERWDKDQEQRAMESRRLQSPPRRRLGAYLSR